MASPLAPARPTPEELARLEQAFASDSSEDAYHALGEAYLALGRHLEAMVVCRKGVRSQPFSAKPHLLMARIQLAQGRRQKAREALDGALDREGKKPEVLQAAAGILVEMGEREEAAELLRRALAAGGEAGAIRNFALAQGLPWEGGEEVPAAAAPAEAATPAGAPPAKAVAPLDAAPAREATPPRQAATGAEAETAPSPPARPGPAPAAERRSRDPLPAPPPKPAATAAKPLDAAGWEDEWEEAPRGGRKGLIRLGVSVVLMLALLMGWSAYSRAKAARDREIASLLAEAVELQRKDSYAGLRAAYEAAERAEQRGAGGVAQLHLAHLAARRWAEHGEAAMLQAARAHLSRVPEGGGEGSRRLAAEALIAAGEGDAAGAIQRLEAALKDPKREGRGLLRTTLGRILAAEGRLEEAAAVFREAVEQGVAGPRLLASLAEVQHRLGKVQEARRAYEEALALEAEHLPARLGKALLLLDSDPPQEAEREAFLEKQEAELEALRQGPEGSLSQRERALLQQAAALLAYMKGDEEEGAKLEAEARRLDPEGAVVRHLQGRRQAQLAK